MVRLEMDRVVDGIILEDCDVVVLGANDVFSKIKTTNGEQQFKVYKRDNFFRNINLFQSKLWEYQNLDILTTTAIFLGCN